MQTKNTSKSIYQEIEDVVFIPKKKSLIKKIIILCVVILFFGTAISAFLYTQGYFTNSSSLLDRKELSSVTNNKDKFQTVKTFTRKPCGLQTGGEEIYTDWFEIKGDVWKIKLSSEKATQTGLSNTRVWYTTSNDTIMDEIIQKKESTYFEIGTGEPSYESGVKNLEQETSGPGIYRLRILCWNTNYSIEIQDSKQ